MKNLILLFMFLIPFVSNSQEIRKKEKIANFIHGSVSIVRSYEDNELTSTDAIWVDRNCEYTDITDIIAIYAGTPKEFDNFLVKSIKFFSENEDGTSTDVQEINLSITKIMGMKQYSIWADSGYTIVTVGKLKKIRKKLAKYL